MSIQVTLEDLHGNVYRRAKLAEAVEVARLIPALISSLNLPITDASGRAITYHLIHDDRSLGENETLAAAGVGTGDTLVIVPEMTAGSQSWMPGHDTLEPLVVLGPAIQQYRPVKGFPQNYQIDLQTDTVMVRFHPGAMQQVIEHAKAHPEKEVGGLLAGSVYQENEHFLVQVEEILEAQHTLAGAAFITITEKSWLDLLQQRDATVFPILGWYHSHPGFGIFLSPSDQFIHRHFFESQPWYIALVVDPISDEWGVFTLEESEIRRCVITEHAE